MGTIPQLDRTLLYRPRAWNELSVEERASLLGKSREDYWSAYNGIVSMLDVTEQAELKTRDEFRPVRIAFTEAALVNKPDVHPKVKDLKMARLIEALLDAARILRGGALGWRP